jgi:hypothetical protein
LTELGFAVSSFHFSVALRLAPQERIRFLIRDPSACHTSELDDCANVKYLSRIELSVRKGRDTRPADEGQHAALHDKQQAPKGA